MGLKLDGIAASQHIDSSGELLHIEGHDISDLVDGKAQLNWEHRNDSPEDIIGQVIYAKKIMKKADCENKRQEMYWDKVKAPFVYIIGELFDDEHHPGAVAAAAMLRYCKKRKIPMVAGFSIEGSTLQRDGYELKRSVGRRVAVTLRPCNKTAISDIYDGDDIEKTMGWDVNPTYKTIEVDDAIFEDVSKSQTLEVVREAIEALKKTLTAGSYNVAPGMLTQGSALQRETLAGLSQEKRRKLVKWMAGWDGKGSAKDFLKAMMPEVSDNYIDHFANVAEQLTIKKSEPQFALLSNKNASFAQDSLVCEACNALPAIELRQDMQGKLKLFPNKDKALYKSPTLGSILIKLGNDPKSHKKIEDAARYYEIAKDYFKVNAAPVTAYFSHPRMYGIKVGASIMNDHSPVGSEPHTRALMFARQNGKLQQLAIIDLVMGVPKRCWSDLSAHGAELMHLNNGPMYQYHEKGANPPSCYSDVENTGLGDDMLIPQVKDWLDTLDPNQLYVYLVNNTGASVRDAEKARSRLEYIKNHAYGKTFYKLFEELGDESSPD